MVQRHSLNTSLFAWICWGIIAALYWLFAALMVVPSAIEYQLHIDLALTVSQIGLVSSAVFFTYTLMQLPCGMILDAYGYRKSVLFFSLIFLVGCILFVFSQGFTTIIISRFMIGLGGSIFFVAAILIANERLSPIIYPVVVALTTSISNLASISILSLYTHFSNYNWRYITSIIVFIIILLMICIWLFIKTPTRTKLVKQPADIPLLKGLVIVAKEPRMWLLVIYIMGCFAHIAAFTFMWRVPLIQKFFADGSISAIKINCLSFIGMALGGVVICYFSAGHNKKIIMLVSAVLELLLLILMYSSVYYYHQTHSVWIFYFWLIGIFGSGFFTSALALSYDICQKYIPQQVYGTACGLLSMAYGLTSVISITLIGFLIKQIKVSGFSFVCLPLICAAGVSIIALCAYIWVDRNKNA